MSDQPTHRITVHGTDGIAVRSVPLPGDPETAMLVANEVTRGTATNIRFPISEDGSMAFIPASSVLYVTVELL